MPIVFMHLEEGGKVLPDHDGQHVEIGRLAAVTLHEARALIAADALEGVINLDRRIQVTDETNALLHELRFADAVRIVLPSG